MNQRFDYSKIDVVEFLESLGISNVKDKGVDVSYSCPFEGHSRGDKFPSATMSKVAIQRDDGNEYPPTTFYCFGCGKAGTAVTFLADYEGISPLIARRLLKEKFGMAFKEPENTLLAELTGVIQKKDDIVKITLQEEIDPIELSKRKLDWVSWRDQGSDLPPPVTYMLNRGFSAEILDEFQIGWDEYSNRLSIPVFDETDRLIGFKGRRWNNEHGSEYNPKYLVLGGHYYSFGTYDVSKILFALPRAKKCIQTFNRMIVVEGELNAISMHQKEFKNTVGISGQYLSPYQITLISSLADEAILYFDELERAQTAAEELERHVMRVKIVPKHEKDAADSTQQEINELLYAAQTPIMLNYI